MNLFSNAIFCGTPHPLPRTLHLCFQSETRPFIRQRLEIGMDRSGGINSFFTLRPRHPDHSFQHHPGSAISDAGSKRRSSHLQVHGRHMRRQAASLPPEPQSPGMLDRASSSRSLIKNPNSVLCHSSKILKDTTKLFMIQSSTISLKEGF